MSSFVSYLPNDGFVGIVVPGAPVVWEIKSTQLSGIYNRSYGFGFDAYYYIRTDSKYLVASPNAWITWEKRKAETWEFFEVQDDRWVQLGQHQSRCPVILPPSAWTDSTPVMQDLGVLFVLPFYPTPTPLPQPTPTPTAILCNQNFSYQGGMSFPSVHNVHLGSTKGTVVLTYTAYSIPDRFVVEFDGLTAIDTGYRGDTSYQTDLNNALGETTLIQGPGYGQASFNKNSSSSLARVKVYAPLPGTAWTFTLNCPIGPTPTPTPTSTPNLPTPTPTIPGATPDPSPTPNATTTPSGTPPATATPHPTRPPMECVRPGSNDVVIHSHSPSPDNAPGPDFQRWPACYVCVEVTTDSSGNVVSSSQTGLTTNNLNLLQILQNRNLIANTAATILYIFVFYGWRAWNPQRWISDDTKYDIYVDASAAVLI